MMSERFIPGFTSREHASKAGAKFFATTSGRKGVEGRDFRLVQNEHGRWHFEKGPCLAQTEEKMP
jgi:hypothetical protein